MCEAITPNKSFNAFAILESRRETEIRSEREMAREREKERELVPEKLRIIHGALRLKGSGTRAWERGFMVRDPGLRTNSAYLSSTTQFSGKGNYFGSPTLAKWPPEVGRAEWIWLWLSRWTDG